MEIEQDCVSTIASLSEHSLAKAKVVLSGLTGSSSKFKRILNHGIEELYERTLKPRLRPLLQDSYKDIKYVVTDEEYAEQEALNSFVNRFMSGLDNLVDAFKVNVKGGCGHMKDEQCFQDPPNVFPYPSYQTVDFDR